jgi:hypothetical protein
LSRLETFSRTESKYFSTSGSERNLDPSARSEIDICLVVEFVDTPEVVAVFTLRLALTRDTTGNEVLIAM